MKYLMATGIRIIIWRVMCTGILLLHCGIIYAVDPTPHILISVQYGSTIDQLGIIMPAEDIPGDCPRTLVCDDAKNIYIGDRVNGKIKKYSAHGELLAATEGSLTNLQFFTVDSQGGVYVVCLDPTTCIYKFNNNENLVWKKHFSQLVTHETETTLTTKYSLNIDGNIRNISCVDKQYIIAEIGGRSQKDNSRKRLGIVIDEAGNYLKTVAYIGSSNGRFYNYTTERMLNSILPTVHMQWYNANGDQMANTELILSKQIEIFQSVETGISRIIIDNNFNTYILAYAIRKKPIVFTPTTAIRLDCIIAKYDADGKFVASYRYEDSPFHTYAENVAILNTGAVMYIAYKALKLQVMESYVK